MNPKKKALFDAGTKVFGKWKPSSYQKQLFECLFVDNKRYVFAEWSRGAGKTVTALKIAFLCAELYPGRAILYIAPNKDMGQGIIADKMLEFPRHLMAERSRASEGLFRFKNGSTLEIVGSEQNVRGREPILVIYDEFRDHNPRAHDAIAPTLRNGGKLLIISTPPRLDDIEEGRSKHYEALLKVCREEKFGSNFFVPVSKVLEEGILSQDFIDMEIAQYRARGEPDEFLAEYHLQRVYKSKDTYFGDIDESMLVPAANMVKLVSAVSEPTWVMIGDTSGSTRWGTLFACLDEHKGKIYLIDSIVRKRQGRNDSTHRDASDMIPSKYWPLLQYKLQKWYPNSTESDWDVAWDHDTTFIDIIPLMFGSHINIDLVEKKYDKKRETFALIRDLIKMNRLYICEDCKDLIEEMHFLSIDPKTKDFSKEKDELLDCLRYLVMRYSACFENKIAIAPEYKGNYFEQLVNNHFKEKIEEDNESDDLDKLFKYGSSW